MMNWEVDELMMMNWGIDELMMMMMMMRKGLCDVGTYVRCSCASPFSH